MLDRLEQLGAAHSETTHLSAVHSLYCGGNGGIALGEGEERQIARAAEDIGLREPLARLDSGLVPWAL